MIGMPPGMQRTAWSKNIALPALSLVGHALLVDLLILRRQRSVLGRSARLVGIELD